MVNDFINGVGAFVMAHWRKDNDLSRKQLDEAIDGIFNQTDNRWHIIIVDDNSPCKEAKEYLQEVKKRDKERIHIIYRQTSEGPGIARNEGIKYAYEHNFPIILFNDIDDISNPRRLELVREKFVKDDDVNVVYSTFIVVDEYTNVVPEDKISSSIKEILDGHKHDIVEGENAWIKIGTEKNYTNLTSSTAVRTELAYNVPFPKVKVSEDTHAWLRYGASKGKFVYDKIIPTLYRVPQNTECATRARIKDFYKLKSDIDTDGFKQAMEIAISNGNIDTSMKDTLMVKFYIKLAESLANGNQFELAKKQISKAMNISETEAKECLKTKEILNI